MQTADFNHEDFDKKNQSALDEKLLVKFFLQTMPDKGATEDKGTPQFKEVEFIDIKVAGSRSGGACRPVRVTDLERFPRHYAAFKNRIEAPVEGMPLKEWPAISRAYVEQLAFMNIKTVEQLANLNDTFCSQLMGGFGLKEKAKEYLAYAEKSNALGEKEALVKTVEDLTTRNAELTTQNEDFMKRLEALESKTVTAAPAKTKPKSKPRKRATAKKK